MALSRVVSEIFNVEKYRDLEIPCQLKVIPFDRLVYGFVLVFYSNYLTTSKMPWPWNPGYGSLKVIGTDNDRSAIYDFLLAVGLVA